MSEKNSKSHKGEPSGANKQEGLGLQGTPPDKMKDFNKMTDEYIEKPDKLQPSVSESHPNRNTSKGQEDENVRK